MPSAREHSRCAVSGEQPESPGNIVQSRNDDMLLGTVQAGRGMVHSSVSVGIRIAPGRVGLEE